MHRWVPRLRLLAGRRLAGGRGIVALGCCSTLFTPCVNSPKHHAGIALQVRAEALGAGLAAVAFVTPSIEQRLKELQPGRGRQAAASSVAGATSVFALQPGLPDAVKQVPVGWGCLVGLEQGMLNLT